MPKYNFIMERRSVSTVSVDVEAENFQQAAQKFSDLTQNPRDLPWGEGMYDPAPLTQLLSVVRDNKHMDGFPSLAFVDSPTWQGLGGALDMDNFPDAFRDFQEQMEEPGEG